MITADLLIDIGIVMTAVGYVGLVIVCLVL